MIIRPPPLMSRARSSQRRPAETRWSSGGDRWAQFNTAPRCCLPGGDHTVRQQKRPRDARTRKFLPGSVGIVSMGFCFQVSELTFCQEDGGQKKQRPPRGPAARHGGPSSHVRAAGHGTSPRSTQVSASEAARHPGQQPSEVRRRPSDRRRFSSRALEYRSLHPLLAVLSLSPAAVLPLRREQRAPAAPLPPSTDAPLAAPADGPGAG